MLVGLTSGIKPFSAEAENVAPVAAEVKPAIESKPAGPVAPGVPASASAPTPAPIESDPVVAAPAPIVVAVEHQQPPAPAPAAEAPQQIEAPPAPVVAEQAAPSKAVEKTELRKSSSSVQAPPPAAEPSTKKSGSQRSSNPNANAASNNNNNNAVAPNKEGGSGNGSQRRKQKDQTKPVNAVVPASQIGLVPADRATALGLKAEEFRAKSKNARSDQEVLELCMEDHGSMCATLSARKTHVAAVRAMWNKDSVWKAVTQMKEAKDLSVVVDVFQTLSSQQLQIVPLEVLNVLLLEMQCLLQSEYEDYVILGCTMLRQVNKVFCPLLKTTRESKPSDVRSDPVLAERIEVSNVCWDTLSKCSLQLKENLGCGGRVSSASREVLALFRRVGL